jgi:hypothetical protein
MIGFIILAAMCYGIYRATKWFYDTIAPSIWRRERDRRIETAMRYGMYDAEAAERIAKQIERESNK